MMDTPLINYDALESGSQSQDEEDLNTTASSAILSFEAAQPPLAVTSIETVRCNYSVAVRENITKARASVSPLVWRTYEEVDLLMQQLKTIVVAAFVLLYLTCIVFLNLAYYRFKMGPRLHDIGHQVLPQVDELSNLVDSPMYCLYPFIGFLFLSTLIPHEGVTKPYLVNMVKRFGCVFAIGHTLRAATYLATSLPGSAKHCLDPEKVEANRPTVPEIFYKPASLVVNCGDLMFSGHMLQMILFVLMIHRYGQKCWVISRTQHRVVLAIVSLLCVAQSCVILMARHHYTSDIVVAFYVTPLLWYFYNNEIDKTDRTPNHERIAAQVLDLPFPSFDSNEQV